MDNVAQSPFPGSDEFAKSWSDWKAYKLEEHKFKYKGYRSEQAALNRLYRLSKGNVTHAVDIIEESMASGWEGLYQTKNYNSNTGAYMVDRGSTVKEVYRPAVRPPAYASPPLGPPGGDDGLTDEAFIISQFEAFNAGRLKPGYVSPQTGRLLIKKGLLSLPAGDALTALTNRAMVMRIQTLTAISSTQNELKYLESVCAEFSAAKPTAVEKKHIEDNTYRIITVDLFIDLRDAALNIKHLL